MKKRLLIICTMLSCVTLLFGCASSNTSNNNTESVEVIENVEQFSRITQEELIGIMGEPVSEESWTNKTSKGDFDVITIQYDKNSNHYEFIIADDSVVRLTIYSNAYWNGAGDKFIFSGEKSIIPQYFNITLGDNVKKVTDNNTTYTLSPVNDKVAEFNVQDVDADTYGFVKITYNLNYFD